MTPASERAEPAAAWWGRRQLEKGVLQRGCLMAEGSEAPRLAPSGGNSEPRAEVESWSVRGPWVLGVGSWPVWGPRAAGSWLSQGQELRGFAREPQSVLCACV